VALLAAGSPLVAGSFQENGMQAAQAVKGPEKQEVRVERAFYFNGKPTKVGETIELPRIFASEMIAAHKAKAIAAKVDNKPVVDEKAAAVERKGGANAR
jgi:hypothetical protein